jgi:hypothetical protein
MQICVPNTKGTAVKWTWISLANISGLFATISTCGHRVQRGKCGQPVCPVTSSIAAYANRHLPANPLWEFLLNSPSYCEGRGQNWIGKFATLYSVLVAWFDASGKQLSAAQVSAWHLNACIKRLKMASMAQSCGIELPRHKSSLKWDTSTSRVDALRWKVDALSIPSPGFPNLATQGALQLCVLECVGCSSWIQNTLEGAPSERLSESIQQLVAWQMD